VLSRLVTEWMPQYSGSDIKLRFVRADTATKWRPSHMFWWYERQGELLRVEVLQIATTKYELHVIAPDGTETVETFTDADSLAKRQEHLQQTVRGDGWTGPHGWVI
jgi:hypothetical protein